MAAAAAAGGGQRGGPGGAASLQKRRCVLRCTCLPAPLSFVACQAADALSFGCRACMQACRPTGASPTTANPPRTHPHPHPRPVGPCLPQTSSSCCGSSCLPTATSGRAGPMDSMMTRGSREAAAAASWQTTVSQSMLRWLFRVLGALLLTLLLLVMAGWLAGWLTCSACSTQCVRRAPPDPALLSVCRDACACHPPHYEQAGCTTIHPIGSHRAASEAGSLGCPLGLPPILTTCFPLPFPSLPPKQAKELPLLFVIACSCLLDACAFALLPKTPTRPHSAVPLGSV